jgi:hypothetical protein
MCGIFLDRAKASSDLGATTAHPDDLVTVAGQQSRGRPGAQLPDVLPSCGADQRPVQLLSRAGG